MTMQTAFHNKYSLVKGVARRARQLQAGAPTVGDSKSMKPCRVAQDEVRSGRVTYTVLEHLARLPIEPEL